MAKAPKLNNVAKLAILFGGIRKLAASVGRDKAIPSRWKNAGGGKVPPYYNAKIVKAAEALAKKRKLVDTPRDSFMADVMACLDNNVCPTCERPMPANTRVDKRRVAA